MSADLTTRYLGLELSGPIMASAGPLTGTLDGLRALEDAGASAVVLPSLFEEDVIEEELHVEFLLDDGEGFAEFASAPLSEAAADYVLEPERHVRLVERAKAALGIPVIASVNAAHPGSWERYATILVEAGADAIELNMYSVAADASESAADVESRKLDIVSAVRAAGWGWRGAGGGSWGRRCGGRGWPGVRAATGGRGRARRCASGRTWPARR